MFKPAFLTVNLNDNGDTVIEVYDDDYTDIVRIH